MTFTVSAYRSVINLYIIIIFSIVTSSGFRCPRDGCRIVRNVILEKILPVYSQQLVPVNMPSTCPFDLSRELFHLQERRKIVEGASRWKCDICGKAFVAEKFLDKHFDNRHRDWIRKGNDSICLSNFCDIFRCDILSGYRRPDFWDIALCMEDDMREIYDKCMAKMKLCVPDKAPGNLSIVISNLLDDHVCSYLTCKKYWDIPEEQRHSDGIVALYIIFSVVIGFGLIVYYCIFYQYYFTDAFADSMVIEQYHRNQRFRNENLKYDLS